MTPLDRAEPEQWLSGRADWIDAELQEALAAHPLECVDTEYPHHEHAAEGPDEYVRPSARHPVFYGCFDWHSAVHSHWCLVRQLRLFPDHPDRSAMVGSIEERLTSEGVEREVAYFEDHPGFEKPYGWSWFLRLAAELELWAAEGGDGGTATAWRETLVPLEETIVSLVETEFLPQERPFRVGTHGNSAFALAGVLDYAETVGDDELAASARQTARRFFSDDEAAPVEYEPLGWDFLSPALTEADLMRRVLGPGAYADWLDGFLPDVSRPPYDRILEPIAVDPEAEEGLELHFVGLNLAKAWCLAGIAEAVPGHRFAETLARSSERHAAAGLELAFTGDYAGSHWLSSFVLYLLSRNEGGIAPG